MPIYRDKTRNCWVFDFSHSVGGRRLRVVKRLPRAWNHAQAAAYDVRTTGELWARITGAGAADPLIDDAVALYITHQVPHLRNGIDAARALNHIAPYYVGRPLSALRDVCKHIMLRHNAQDGTPLAPATIKNRISYLRAAVNYAWRAHGLGGDAKPGATAVVPVVRNESDAYYTRRDMLRLCLQIQRRDVRAMVRKLWYSGKRYTELATATIDHAAQTLTIAREHSKNGTPDVQPIHPKVRSAFTVPPPAYCTARYHLAKARAAIGLSAEHTIHKLRHGTAVGVLRAGGTLTDVQAVLNQKSASSAKRYAHFVIDVKRAATARLGKVA